VDVKCNHSSASAWLEAYIYPPYFFYCGKAVTFSEWATLAQDRAGWLELATKVSFDIGKPQLRPTARRVQDGVLSSMQKQTQKRPKSGSKIYFMNSFHFREG